MNENLVVTITHTSLVIVTFSLFLSVRSFGVVLTYDETTSSSPNFIERSITESSFRTTGTFANHTSPGGWAANDTAGVGSVACQGSYAVTSILGDAFDAISIDLSEYSTVFSGLPAEVTFIGTNIFDQQASASFLTDGSIDGSEGIEDFQTFIFPEDFNNLVRLEVEEVVCPVSGGTDVPFSFDNLNVVSVPEPTTFSATLLGLGLLLSRRQRGKPFTVRTRRRS